MIDGGRIYDSHQDRGTTHVPARTGPAHSRSKRGPREAKHGDKKKRYLREQPPAKVPPFSQKNDYQSRLSR